MAISLTAVRYYTSDDDYEYNTDNRPLQDLAQRDLDLRTELENTQTSQTGLKNRLDAITDDTHNDELDYKAVSRQWDPYVQIPQGNVNTSAGSESVWRVTIPEDYWMRNRLPDTGAMVKAYDAVQDTLHRGFITKVQAHNEPSGEWNFHIVWNFDKFSNGTPNKSNIATGNGSTFFISNAYEINRINNYLGLPVSYYEGSVQTLSGEPVGEGTGSKTQFTGTLEVAPISSGSITITAETSAGTKTITDDGSGNLTGDVDGGGNNTINYDTGAFDVTFDSAPDDGETVRASYESAKKLFPNTYRYFSINSGTDPNIAGSTPHFRPAGPGDIGVTLGVGVGSTVTPTGQAETFLIQAGPYSGNTSLTNGKIPVDSTLTEGADAGDGSPDPFPGGSIIYVNADYAEVPNPLTEDVALVGATYDNSRQRVSFPPRGRSYKDLFWMGGIYWVGNTISSSTYTVSDRISHLAPITQAILRRTVTMPEAMRSDCIGSFRGTIHNFNIRAADGSSITSGGNHQTAMFTHLNNTVTLNAHSLTSDIVHHRAAMVEDHGVMFMVCGADLENTPDRPLTPHRTEYYVYTNTAVRNTNDYPSGDLVAHLTPVARGSNVVIYGRTESGNAGAVVGANNYDLTFNPSVEVYSYLTQSYQTMYSPGANSVSGAPAGASVLAFENSVMIYGGSSEDPSDAGTPVYQDRVIAHMNLSNVFVDRGKTNGADDSLTSTAVHGAVSPTRGIIYGGAYLNNSSTDFEVSTTPYSINELGSYWTSLGNQITNQPDLAPSVMQNAIV